MVYSEDKARARVCVRPVAASRLTLTLMLHMCPVAHQAKDGGNLGWKRREELNGIFAEAAFKLAKGKARALRGCCRRDDSPENVLSRSPQMTPQPVKTSHGYHLILVEDRKA